VSKIRETPDPELDALVRSRLHASVDRVRVPSPPAETALAVLGRAQQTERRRQHRGRAVAGAAVVLLVLVSVIGLTRVRDDGTRTVGAGATAPGSQVPSTTGSVGTVAPMPTTLEPVPSSVAPAGTRAPAKGGGTIVPPLTVAPGPPPVPVSASSDGVPHLLLPGWTTVGFSTLDASAGSGGPPYVEYQFARDDQRLQLSFYAESEYGTRVGHLIEPVPVRGGNGQLLDYGNGRYRVDFIEGNRTWEADGGPFASPQAIVDVLETIEGADPQTWKASLPADAVTAETRFETVEQILVQVPIPPGFDVEALKTKNLPSSRYDLTAKVIGSVECAWIRRWLDAPPDSTQRPEAVAALGGVASWPALKAMRADGAYPDAAVDYARRAVRGDREGLAGYEQALGC